MLEGRVREMIRTVSTVKGVTAEVTVPKIANQVPHLAVRWGEAEKKLTTQQVVRQLREGEPPIAVLGSGPGRLTVSVWMMRGNEHRTVARRLREILAQV